MSGSIVAFPHSSAARPAVPATERLRRVLSAVVQEWRLNRDLAELRSLDGRALRDLGLTRGSLEGAVRFGRNGAPLRAEDPAEPASVGAPAMPASWTEWR